MKKLTVIALSLIAAGAAMADGLSRQQVVAELQRARSAGELTQWQSENPEAFGRATVAGGSQTSRAAVLADLKQARANGELERVDSESYGPSVAFTSTKSRSEVLAELQRARANGELQLRNGDHSDYPHLAALKQHQPANELLAGQPASAR
ncbi:MAG TPA: DUF4148 domain-containing protein [Roseateles sp.]|nr:DUF4148 domain-containing protein [Roseateles sp.]